MMVKPSSSSRRGAFKVRPDLCAIIDVGSFANDPSDKKTGRQNPDIKMTLVSRGIDVSYDVT